MNWQEISAVAATWLVLASFHRGPDFRKYGHIRKYQIKNRDKINKSLRFRVWKKKGYSDSEIEAMEAAFQAEKVMTPEEKKALRKKRQKAAKARWLEKRRAADPEKVRRSQVRKEMKAMTQAEREECLRKKRREYYEKNKDRLLEQAKEHRRKNPEKNKEAVRRYYQKRKKEILARQKANYLKKTGVLIDEQLKAKKELEQPKTKEQIIMEAISEKRRRASREHARKKRGLTPEHIEALEALRDAIRAGEIYSKDTEAKKEFLANYHLKKEEEDRLKILEADALAAMTPEPNPADSQVLVGPDTSGKLVLPVTVYYRAGFIGFGGSRSLRECIALERTEDAFFSCRDGYESFPAGTEIENGEIFTLLKKRAERNKSTELFK